MRRAAPARRPVPPPCHELGFGPDCAAVLFRFYLQRVSETTGLRNRLPALAASVEAKGRATARFSARLNDELHERLQQLEKSSGLNKAAIVKGIIMQMKQDVLDNQRPALQRDLKEILRLAA
ncbi:MAG: hypothetical protein A2289_13350 [Deltaproteobacteria bacterium RIFOXYA12_FULL_58_15]|nr:MAG: hypothetical protein A2289_13350 [Deltaproteobacteria bacterium RIFOXYA12_FULL_58_15]OGR10622.1 MAG: hypothetical protein A2341_01000 [Deltaproteobacteria bacterium RIFOXYB12_FULL_58_9]